MSQKSKRKKGREDVAVKEVLGEEEPVGLGQESED